MIKAWKKLRIKGIYFNILKVRMSNFYLTVLNGENLKPFSLKSGMRQGYPLSPL
jgi:hypothetical protein